MRFSCKCDFEYFRPKHSASHLLAFSHVFWNTCHPLWRKMQSPFFNVTAGSQPAELENLFIPPRENPRRSPLHVTWALDIFSSLFFYFLCLASLLITLPFFQFYFSYINVETECLSLLNLLWKNRFIFPNRGIPHSEIPKYVFLPLAYIVRYKISKGTSIKRVTAFVFFERKTFQK